MKNILLIVFTLFLFLSCKDETIIPPPVISEVEIGHENSKTVARGSDLHVEAQVVAQGNIRTAEIHIHGSYWEIEVDFPELVGKKGGEIHSHIEIPAQTPAGNYHIHISVTDQEGQATAVESDLFITD